MRLQGTGIFIYCQWEAKLHMYLPFHPAITLQGACPANISAYTQNDVCIWLFTMAFIYKSKILGKNKHFSKESWSNKQLYIHPMEH